MSYQTEFWIGGVLTYFWPPVGHWDHLRQDKPVFVHQDDVSHRYQTIPLRMPCTLVQRETGPPYQPCLYDEHAHCKHKTTHCSRIMLLYSFV